MKKIRSSLTSAAVSLIIALGIFVATPLAVNASPADEVTKGLNATGTQNESCGDDGEQPCTVNDGITSIVQVLLFIIGTVAVIMIVIGGIRYTTSNGDSNQIAAAKNTILYAVIGLIVALLSYAIVSFIVNEFAN